MITAIIIAGGNGTRTGQAVPKQFLTVYDIPIIAYTMMNVQSVEAIDRIIVVGPAGWDTFITTYANQFSITKLEAVVPGGETRNESIYNGLHFLEANNVHEKVCLIDANRPMIPKSVFLDVISLADQCDCAVAAEPCHDSMFISHDGKTIQENIDRSMLFRGSAPECASLKTFLELYADVSAIRNASLSTTGLAAAKGKHVMMAKANIKCFKITTADDFELFKALLKAEPLTNIMTEKQQ